MVFQKSAKIVRSARHSCYEKYHVVNIEDLLQVGRWAILAAPCGGHVTDVQVSKRRLLDEASGREAWRGTTVTVVIRYRVSARWLASQKTHDDLA